MHLERMEASRNTATSVKRKKVTVMSSLFGLDGVALCQSVRYEDDEHKLHKAFVQGCYSDADDSSYLPNL